MPFSVEKVNSRSRMREFIELPYRLYRDDPYWVPPIKVQQKELFDRKKHPFHEHAEVEFYLARDGEGSVCGRVASIVNHAHNSYHDEKTGFFGFLEADRDSQVFSRLLSACEDNLAEAGMDRVRGPMNYSTNEECGLLVKGFDSSPMIMMPYNPQWYSDFIEAAGYVKVKDLYAYSIMSLETDFSRISRVAELVKKRTNAVLRDISVKNIHREVPMIMDIYNECWEDNWGFVPMSQRELDMMADELKLIMVPRMAPIIEVDGEAVAFAVAIPDVNQALKKAKGSLIRAVLALKVPLFRVKIDQCRVLLLGVRKAFRGRGFEALLINRIVKESIAFGVRRGELSWILEDNLSMRKILERGDFSQRYRTYRVYQKEI